MNIPAWSSIIIANVWLSKESYFIGVAFCVLAVFFLIIGAGNDKK